MGDSAPLESESSLIARAASGVVGVQRVDDPDELRSIVQALVAGTTREVCSMLPGGPYPLRYLISSWDQDLELIARGVRPLCLYQADAVREPGVLKYLSDFAAAGAQVRIARRVTHRTIICDRQVVLVAVGQDQLSLPVLIVREAALVRTFHASFAQAWKSSSSVGVGPEDSVAAANVAETISILQSGVTDEVAARQLGISVRTVRRRVAAVMELLDANSRFEAGVKAAKAGWI